MIFSTNSAGQIEVHMENIILNLDLHYNRNLISNNYRSKYKNKTIKLLGKNDHCHDLDLVKDTLNRT